MSDFGRLGSYDRFKLRRELRSQKTHYKYQLSRVEKPENTL